MRVLLVEDDPATSRAMEATLTRAGLTVYATSTGEDAVDLARSYDHDLILLDLGLPDMSGREVIRRLRGERVTTPVMVLTADETADSKVSSLHHGADDYLVKPVDRQELVARAHALIRRAQGHAQSVIRIGPLALDLDAKLVAVGATPVHLTAKEYGVLELLSLRKGRTVTKEMLLNHLYGGLHEPEIKIVDVFVCKLRKKIADANRGGSLIETVWGRGYLLRDPEQPLAAEEAARPLARPVPSLHDRGATRRLRAG